MKKILFSLMMFLPMISYAQIEEETSTENLDEYRDCIVYTVEEADQTTALTGNVVSFTFSDKVARLEETNADCGEVAYIEQNQSNPSGGGSSGGDSVTSGGGSSSGNGGGSSSGNGGGTPSTPSQPSNPEPTPTPEPEPEPEPTPEPEPEPTPEPTPAPTPEPEPEEECHDCYTLNYKGSSPKSCKDGYVKAGYGTCWSDGPDYDCYQSCCKPGCHPTFIPK